MTSNAARGRPIPLVFALLAVVALLGARRAAAALGEDVVSIQADQLRMEGTLRTSVLPGYVAHEIQTPTGTLVRELASPAGAVFGVSWEGPFLPNLRRLLGSSFDAYATAARAARRGRGPLLLHLPGLVFESSGHPRGFRGRAYIPELVPEGVLAEAIR
jgi:Protein of unknown function (DUF2844)